MFFKRSVVFPVIPLFISLSLTCRDNSFVVIGILPKNIFSKIIRFLYSFFVVSFSFVPFIASGKSIVLLKTLFYSNRFKESFFYPILLLTIHVHITCSLINKEKSQCLYVTFWTSSSMSKSINSFFEMILSRITANKHWINYFKIRKLKS